MRLLSRCVIATLLTGVSTLPVFSQTAAPLKNSRQTAPAIQPAEFTASTYKPGHIRHIVLFRYRPEITEAQKTAIMMRFLNLKETAQRDGKPYIVALHAGTQNSFENADHGFSQAFIVEFKSEGDRNYYVGSPIVSDPKFFDPEHDKFKKIVGPLLGDQGALVFDFNNES